MGQLLSRTYNDVAMFAVLAHRPARSPARRSSARPDGRPVAPRPTGLLDKADRAAYAVCHRIPERSFAVAGRQLPLCARCSGTYLGALAALLTLSASGRRRAGRFPTRPYLLVLGLFLAAWAGDGFNSFLTLLGLPHLYEPANPLRLVTGALAGHCAGSILLPALNVTFWREPADRRSIERPSHLLWLLFAAGRGFRRPDGARLDAVSAGAAQRADGSCFARLAERHVLPLVHTAGGPGRTVDRTRGAACRGARRSVRARSR